jgi:membrane protease YdiL (CAAX protease family)
MNKMMEIISGGYDTMDMSDPLQSVLQLGSLAIAIPSLWLASLIVRDRPMSSYSSSRGGWSRRVFWRCMPVAFIINGLPIIINDVIIEKGYQNFTVKFTVLSFILLTILGPLQCIAEEYMFRGFVMQTFGSWFRIPVIAVILQALIFAAGHPYNRIGQIAVAISGAAFALSAWFGRGLEVSAALHIVNNMTIFYLQGFGMTTVSSDTSVSEMLIDLGIAVVYVAVIFWLSRKTRWFDKVRKDDAARVNAKLAEKKAKKAAKKAARAARKAGTTVFEVAGNAGSATDVVSERAENITEASPEMYYDTAAAGEVPEFDYTRSTGNRSSEGGKHFKH